jgi:hypothetical protein
MQGSLTEFAQKRSLFRGIATNLCWVTVAWTPKADEILAPQQLSFSPLKSFCVALTASCQRMPSVTSRKGYTWQPVAACVCSFDRYVCGMQSLTVQTRKLSAG